MKRIISVTTLNLAAIFLIAGCFSAPRQERQVSASNPPPEDLYDLSPINFPSGTANVAPQVLGFKGVDITYGSLTEVAIPANGRVNETGADGAGININSDRPSYSQDESIASLNAPMILSQMRLAAELCLGVLKREAPLAASQRKYFNNINFLSPLSSQVNASSNAFSDSINRISTAWCGHPADQSHIDDIKNELLEATKDDSGVPLTDRRINLRLENSGVNNGVRKQLNNASGYYEHVVDSAMLVCTAYLASACTLVNN